jgi:hypothetical protein
VVAAPDVTRAGVALGLALLACAGPAWAQGPSATGVERRQSYPTTPPPEEGVPLFDVSAALRGGVQWIVNPPRARDDVFGFGALDVVLTLRPTPDITLLVDVEALGGPGPDQALGTLSRLNQEAERLEGREARAFLREAWVRMQWLDGTVRFNVGKLDPGHYFDRNFFAEDETRQFLDAALLANPLLKAPPNGPGTSLRISQGDWRYAFGVHAPGDFDDDLSGLPYFIAELGRRNIFPLKGHYRWWARVTSVADRRDDITWATGLSIDQRVTDNTGLFLRASLARSEGESLTAHAWSAGVQHTPTWLGRPRDLTGIGYSFQHESPGREHAAEAYYNVALATWCTVIANVQWIFSGPNQVTGGRNRDVIVPGVRMLLLY